MKPFKAIKRALGWAGIGAVSFSVSTGALAALDDGPAGRWAYNFWAGLDRFANAALGGDPRETISSRLGKQLEDEWVPRRVTARVVCFFLDPLERDHCRKSVDETVGDRGVIP